MLFQLMLFGLYVMLKVSSWISKPFRARLKEKNMTMVIRTVDGCYGRTYTFNNGKITSKSGAVDNPDFAMIWSDPKIAAKVLMQASKGPQVIMTAMGKKKLTLAGDASAMQWFILTMDKMKNVYMKSK